MTNKKTGVEESKKIETKLTAKQKIEAIENKLMVLDNRLLGFDQQFNVVAEEIDNMASIVQQLVRRLNAIVKATESEAGVNQIMMDSSIEELKGKVDFLIEQGALKEDKEKLIDDMTFIVCRQVDDEGNVVNQRIQFAILSLADAEVKAPFLNRKLGDIVITEDGVKLEITEVYNMYEIKQEKNFEEPKNEEKAVDISPLEEELDKANKEAVELKEATDKIKKELKD